MPIPGQPTKPLFTPWQAWLFDVSRDGVIVFASTVLLIGIGLFLGGWFGHTPTLDQYYTETHLSTPMAVPPETAESALQRALEEGHLARTLALIPAAAQGSSMRAPSESVIDMLSLIALSELSGEQKQVALGLLLSMTQSPIQPFPDLVELATREHPPLLANRALRWIYLAAGNEEAAAASLKREALHPDSRAEKVLYLQYLIEADRNEEALQFIEEVELDPAIASGIQYEVLVNKGDWIGLLQLVTLNEIGAWTRLHHVGLALVGLSVWLLFLIQQMAAPEFRRRYLLLAGAAVLLGAFSVVPTLLMVLYQDVQLGMEINGDPWNDFLYFFFGVGLREELAKLLCLLPLVPLLLKTSRLNQLIISACVGLGFGFQENLQYFHNATSAVAYARALSANFLHLSLTGMLGLAFFDIFRTRFKGFARFTQTFFLVILLHALYDLFLVNQKLARMGYVEIFCLSLMAVWFFTELRRERGPQLDFLMPRTLLQLGLTALFSGTILIAATEIGFFLACLTVAATAVGLGMAIAIFHILSEDVTLHDYFEGDDQPASNS